MIVDLCGARACRSDFDRQGKQGTGSNKKRDCFHEVFSRWRSAFPIAAMYAHSLVNLRYNSDVPPAAMKLRPA
jgi:hypothetical protein